MIDSSGKTPETVFDIISLGASLVDVVVDPWNPWNWIGLLGDVADVALPFVGGLGEAVKILKAMNVIDESVDVVEITKNTLNMVSKAAEFATTCEGIASTGLNCVYYSEKVGKSGILEYVGITNDFDRRESEWKKIRQIKDFTTDVDRDAARCAEQTIIALFGRGGDRLNPDCMRLSNVRNSIGVNSKLSDAYRRFFKSFF